MRDTVIVAEYRLLNALVSNEEYRKDSRVHKDLFIHETAKSLYQAIEKLEESGTNISPASLLQAGSEIDFNVNKGIIDAVFEVDQKGINTLDDIVSCLSKSKQKKLINDKLRELSRTASEEGDLDLDVIMQGIFDIDTIVKTGVSDSIMMDFNEWSNTYIEELKRRSTGKQYTYGDELLDKLIRKGAYPGAITTIAAATGQGKSTFVRNLISNLIDLYIPCMYISLEMSGVDTYDSLISSRRGIPMEDLYTYDDSLLSVIDIVEDEKKQLQDNNKFYFVEEPDLSLARLKSLIKEFKQRTKSDYALIAVDLVTQIKDFMTTRGGKSVANAYEEAMNTLNEIAKTENVHFIAVVQFNRNADNFKVSSIDDLENLRPSLNDIKNGAAIAERSRVVLSVFRKRYYADRYLTNIPEASEIPDILELQVLKNSSGTVGNILKYFFEGNFFRVTPVLEDETPEDSLGVNIEY